MVTNYFVIFNMNCGKCSKSCHSYKRLKHHCTKRHPEYTVLSCMFCEFVALEESEMKQHKKSSHPQGRLHCGKCGFSSRSWKKFRRHETTAHDNKCDEDLQILSEETVPNGKQPKICQDTFVEVVEETENKDIKVQHTDIKDQNADIKVENTYVKDQDICTQDEWNSQHMEDQSFVQKCATFSESLRDVVIGKQEVDNQSKIEGFRDDACHPYLDPHPSPFHQNLDEKVEIISKLESSFSTEPSNFVATTCVESSHQSETGKEISSNSCQNNAVSEKEPGSSGTTNLNCILQPPVEEAAKKPRCPMKNRTGSSEETISGQTNHFSSSFNKSDSREQEPDVPVNKQPKARKVGNSKSSKSVPSALDTSQNLDQLLDCPQPLVESDDTLHIRQTQKTRRHKKHGSLEPIPSALDASKNCDQSQFCPQSLVESDDMLNLRKKTKTARHKGHGSSEPLTSALDASENLNQSQGCPQALVESDDMLNLRKKNKTARHKRHGSSEPIPSALDASKNLDKSVGCPQSLVQSDEMLNLRKKNKTARHKRHGSSEPIPSALDASENLNQSQGCPQALVESDDKLNLRKKNQNGRHKRHGSPEAIDLASNTTNVDPKRHKSIELASNLINVDPERKKILRQNLSVDKVSYILESHVEEVANKPRRPKKNRIGSSESAVSGQTKHVSTSSQKSDRRVQEPGDSVCYKPKAGKEGNSKCSRSVPSALDASKNFDQSLGCAQSLVENNDMLNLRKKNKTSRHKRHGSSAAFNQASDTTNVEPNKQNVSVDAVSYDHNRNNSSVDNAGEAVNVRRKRKKLPIDTVSEKVSLVQISQREINENICQTSESFNLVQSDNSINPPVKVIKRLKNKKKHNSDTRGSGKAGYCPEPSGVVDEAQVAIESTNGVKKDTPKRKSHNLSVLKAVAGPECTRNLLVRIPKIDMIAGVSLPVSDKHNYGSASEETQRGDKMGKTSGFVHTRKDSERYSSSSQFPPGEYRIRKTQTIQDHSLDNSVSLLQSSVTENTSASESILPVEVKTTHKDRKRLKKKNSSEKPISCLQYPIEADKSLAFTKNDTSNSSISERFKQSLESPVSRKLLKKQSKRVNSEKVGEKTIGELIVEKSEHHSHSPVTSIKKGKKNEQRIISSDNTSPVTSIKKGKKNDQRNISSDNTSPVTSIKKVKKNDQRIISSDNTSPVTSIKKGKKTDQKIMSSDNTSPVTSIKKGKKTDQRIMSSDNTSSSGSPRLSDSNMSASLSQCPLQVYVKIPKLGHTSSLQTTTKSVQVEHTCSSSESNVSKSQVTSVKPSKKLNQSKNERFSQKEQELPASENKSSKNSRNLERKEKLTNKVKASSSEEMSTNQDKKILKRKTQVVVSASSQSAGQPEKSTSKSNHGASKLRSSTTQVKGKYSCSVCQKAYVTSGGLAQHKLAHNAPFVCDICQKRFTKKHNLTNHMRLHTGERPFVCPHCDYTATIVETLYQHLRMHQNQKPYECKLCDYKTAYRSNLLFHRAKHSTDRPFSCDLCSRRFKRSDHLKVHRSKLHIDVI